MFVKLEENRLKFDEHMMGMEDCCLREDNKGRAPEERRARISVEDDKDETTGRNEVFVIFFVIFLYSCTSV